jgi:DNA transformation protein
MRNLGPVSRAWLAAVGIHGLDDLRAVGSVGAWRLVAERLRGTGEGSASLLLLWALEGALLDVDWRDLPAGVKDALRRAATGS